MIPVVLAQEPEKFNEWVRKPGLQWLDENCIAHNAPLPKKKHLPTFWTHQNKDLWDAYGGVCAYLAIYFEWPSGAGSTDHFLPKSQFPGLAYEWSNYRLSCLAPNRLKNKFNDVIDPLLLLPNTFVLNLASGEIRPNSSLHPTQIQAAKATIKRLKLDSQEHNQMRARHFSEYIAHRHAPTLKKYSPFVWYEADRQGLL